eukprot:2381174-Rhodomonas_salina.3
MSGALTRAVCGTAGSHELRPYSCGGHGSGAGRVGGRDRPPARGRSHRCHAVSAKGRWLLAESGAVFCEGLGAGCAGFIAASGTGLVSLPLDGLRCRI